MTSLHGDGTVHVTMHHFNEVHVITITKLTTKVVLYQSFTEKGSSSIDIIEKSVNMDGENEKKRLSLLIF